MLFVGDGGVGKTSVINRLLFDSYNEQESKTEGIEIKSFEFEDEKEIIKLNFWDFGGQEIMHSTHQFFLTNRSLYILLWDARQEDRYGLVEYWLELIQSFGGDSPILVVTNKIDENSASLDEEFLKEKYKNIKGFYKISCKENWGIDKLKEAIKIESLKLPHIRDYFPLDWFEIKDKIESLKEQNIDFIKYDEYIKFCTKKNITEPKERRLLIDILHDLGIILNFRDDKRLKNIGVINPIWVTDGIYKILNSSILLKNRGILEQSDLDEILKEHRKKYPESKDIFLLDLMEKFELSFQVERDRYLIAGALPKDTPKIEWNKSKSLLFRYDYNFLPQSIISRFIVKAHEDIDNYLWLNGVVLKSGSIKALIQADRVDKKIFIYIDSFGSEARAFLSVIRNYFDKVHSTIKTIEAKEMVPLPDNHKIAVPYKHLLDLERGGEREFKPYEVNKKYNISILLNNIENQRSKEMSNNEKIVNNININNSNGDGNINQAGGSNNSATLNNNQNSELDKKLNELIEQINQNQIENSKEIVENLKKLKNDKKSLNDYLIDLLGVGGNIGSIAGGISGVLALLKDF